MKRFEQGMVPSRDGEYVLYEEHTQEMGDMQDKIDKLIDKIELLEGQVEYYMNN